MSLWLHGFLELSRHLKDESWIASAVLHDELIAQLDGARNTAADATFSLVGAIHQLIPASVKPWWDDDLIRTLSRSEFQNVPLGGEWVPATSSQKE